MDYLVLNPVPIQSISCSLKEYDIWTSLFPVLKQFQNISFLGKNDLKNKQAKMNIISQIILFQFLNIKGEHLILISTEIF